MKGGRSTPLVFFKEVKLSHHCLCDLDGEIPALEVMIEHCRCCQIYLRLQEHAMVISQPELMVSHCKPQSEQKWPSLEWGKLHLLTVRCSAKIIARNVSYLWPQHTDRKVETGPPVTSCAVTPCGECLVLVLFSYFWTLRVGFALPTSSQYHGQQ